MAEMFGGSDFWLETRVIIKISKKGFFKLADRMRSDFWISKVPIFAHFHKI